ncbi:MAG: hypothetical protein AAF617_16250 [Bacteroidota bacterium]
MKKIYLGMLVAFLTVCTSCKFSETIYINDDGSGKMSFYLDGSELMPMMGGQVAGTQWDGIDSLISFKDVLSVAKYNLAQIPQGYQKQLKSLEKLNVEMQIDSKKNKMNFDVFANFNSVTDLQSTFGAITELGELAAKSSSAVSKADIESLPSMKYAFSNNVFKRSFSVANKKLLDSLKQNLGQAEMLMAASTYTLDYHFPKKIKSVSLEDAILGKDGKSFTYEIRVIDFINDPERLNFNVELEK